MDLSTELALALEGFMQYIQFMTGGRLRVRREFDRSVLQSYLSGDVKWGNKQINIMLN